MFVIDAIGGIYAMHVMQFNNNKKLSYRRGTARRIMSVEILPTASVEQ